MTAYFNENDPFAAAWLRELVAAKLICPGEIDERSIEEVTVADLKGYTQHHFFAGIGVWSYALRTAGWPDDSPVWSGSCPCQGFSASGNREGFSDHRHLWPAWFRLAREFRPHVIFGEQVSGKDGLAWFDTVSADLENEGYAVGALDTCAAGVGAPHIRQRLYFVADSNGQGRPGRETATRTGENVLPERQGAFEWVADADLRRRKERNAGERGIQLADEGGQLGNASSGRFGIYRGASGETGRPAQSSRGLDDARKPRLERHARNDAANRGTHEARSIAAPRASFWHGARQHRCTDGRFRLVPSEPFFQFPFARLTDIMGGAWIRGIAQIEKEITRHADATETRPGEVLRALWNSAAQAARGGDACVYEAQVLLLALCESARRSQSLLEFTASDLAEIQEETLRTLWEAQASPRSPQGSQLEKPRSEKSGNALYCVPSASAAQAAFPAVHGLRTAGATAQNVSKALVSLQEIWRCAFDEGQETGNPERLFAGACVVKAMNCFPLSKKIPGRVGLLRGIGNSLCAPQAVAFIEAYLEIKKGPAVAMTTGPLEQKR